MPFRLSRGIVTIQYHSGIYYEIIDYIIVVELVKFAAGLTKVLICSFLALLSVHHKKFIVNQGTRISSICGLSHFSSCRRSCACAVNAALQLSTKRKQSQHSRLYSDRKLLESTRKGVNPDKMLMDCQT